MKVSVIVPVYRVERYIARCAKSLLEQTFSDKEIIFVDDASPDRSVEVLKSVIANCSQQVQILHHAQNRGLAAARKTGLEAAKGEYIVSLDSDDYLEPDALQLLVAEAERTNADMVGMDCYFEWNDKRSLYRGAWTADAKEYGRYLLSGRTLPGVCLHMIKKDLYTQADLLPIEGLDCGEDYVLTPRLCWFAQRVAHVAQPLYHYTQTNNSSISQRVSQKNILQLKQVLEVLGTFFADKPEYAQALRAGQWLKKTDLMMRAAREDYALADTMPAALPVNTETMTFPLRLAAVLVANQCWTSLWFYSRCYGGLLEILQVLKGRRKKC